jgi:nucleotide-binding universal stress UspA family protein
MTSSSPAVPVLADPLATGGRLVVGVDESPHAAAALRWALREAILRRASLEVLHAWQPPVAALPFGANLPLSIDEGELDNAARAQLDRVVDSALAELDVPAPEVQRTVVPGPAVVLLIDAAQTADLLVVGSHGRTGLRRLVLGSVANACIQHAPCPVVVIRLPEEAEEQPEQPAGSEESAEHT